MRIEGAKYNDIKEQNRNLFVAQEQISSLLGEISQLTAEKDLVQGVLSGEHKEIPLTSSETIKEIEDGRSKVDFESCLQQIREQLANCSKRAEEIKQSNEALLEKAKATREKIVQRLANERFSKPYIERAQLVLNERIVLVESMAEELGDAHFSPMETDEGDVVHMPLETDDEKDPDIRQEECGRDLRVLLKERNPKRLEMMISWRKRFLENDKRDIESYRRLKGEVETRLEVESMSSEKARISLRKKLKEIASTLELKEESFECEKTALDRLEAHKEALERVWSGERLKERLCSLGRVSWMCWFSSGRKTSKRSNIHGLYDALSQDGEHGTRIKRSLNAARRVSRAVAGCVAMENIDYACRVIQPAIERAAVGVRGALRKSIGQGGLATAWPAVENGAVDVVAATDFVLKNVDLYSPCILALDSLVDEVPLWNSSERIAGAVAGGVGGIAAGVGLSIAAPAVSPFVGGALVGMLSARVGKRILNRQKTRSSEHRPGVRKRPPPKDTTKVCSRR